MIKASASPVQISQPPPHIPSPPCSPSASAIIFLRHVPMAWSRKHTLGGVGKVLQERSEQTFTGNLEHPNQYNQHTRGFTQNGQNKHAILSYKELRFQDVGHGSTLSRKPSTTLPTRSPDSRPPFYEAWLSDYYPDPGMTASPAAIHLTADRKPHIGWDGRLSQLYRFPGSNSPGSC